MNILTIIGINNHNFAQLQLIIKFQYVVVVVVERTLVCITSLIVVGVVVMATLIAAAAVIRARRKRSHLRYSLLCRPPSRTPHYSLRPVCLFFCPASES